MDVSESFTAEVGVDYKKVRVDVNNDPMIKGKFKVCLCMSSITCLVLLKKQFI